MKNLRNIDLRIPPPQELLGSEADLTLRKKPRSLRRAVKSWGFEAAGVVPVAVILRLKPGDFAWTLILQRCCSWSAAIGGSCCCCSCRRFPQSHLRAHRVSFFRLSSRRCLLLMVAAAGPGGKVFAVLPSFSSLFPVPEISK